MARTARKQHNETPGERLRRARMARFSSAAQAAEEMGWRYSTLVSHENGSRPLTESAARKYAPALGVTWRWLLDGLEADHMTRMSAALANVPAADRERMVQAFERLAGTG